MKDGKAHGTFTRAIKNLVVDEWNGWEEEKVFIYTRTIDTDRFLFGATHQGEKVMVYDWIWSIWGISDVWESTTVFLESGHSLGCVGHDQLSGLSGY